MKLSLAVIKSTIAAMIGTGGPLDNVFVGLYTAGPAAGPGVVLGDLTEATFTGYARVEVANWSAAYVTSDGKVTIDGNNVHFSPSDAVTPNIVIGWFIATASTAGTLLGMEQFASTKPMQAADNGVTVVPRLQFPQANDYGSGTVAA